METFYCAYCGTKESSVRALTGGFCQRNPDKGKHKLYEGEEKDTYVCKYCGTKENSIRSLTGSPCQRHPDGAGKHRHAPAL